MKRSYFHSSAADFAEADPMAVLGALAEHLPFALEPLQKRAWQFQIEHLRNIATTMPDAHFLLEFLIPRMGRRADTIILYGGVVFVVEYKVGDFIFSRSAIDQVLGYALDLKNFHETSHSLPIVPVLVATLADREPVSVSWAADGVAVPLLTGAEGLSDVILEVARGFSSTAIDPHLWMAGRYKPTPTIVEAAQALYRGHDVNEIARSEAGAENLTVTSTYVENVIERSKREGRKSICFVTGVPGSGKTLAGLSIANDRMRAHDDEHAVFLSGNGPLVEVLREALTLDALEQRIAQGTPRPSRVKEYQKACAFIQNIHHFRDDNLASDRPPIEKVVVFDEAQRAWNEDKTSQFMREKKGQIGFAMSEPQFLLSVMDRHEDWCTVVALIGGGQEINTGEAGLLAWLSALAAHYPDWDVYLPQQVLGREYLLDQAGESVSAVYPTLSPALHLMTSIRSFRAEKLSDFVGAIIEGDSERARELGTGLADFPIFLTRDLDSARQWLRHVRRGPERAGLLASSNALRLKPEGVFVRSKIEPGKWFLAPRGDIRSSDSLEDAATEFDVQGLELDWACVCWDANLRWSSGAWDTFAFRGASWQRVNDLQRRAYLLNSYRVLLTRARQGMVIFVPRGDLEDITRSPSYYDPIYQFLRDCGIVELEATGRPAAHIIAAA